MHNLAQFVEFLAWPLLALAHFLTPAVATTGHRQPIESDFTVSAFAVATGAFGLICCFWTARTRARLWNIHQDAKARIATLESDLRLRDAVLGTAHRDVVILGGDLDSPVSFGQGAELLEAGLAGRDAAVLATALDALLKKGTSFEFSIRTATGNRLFLRAVSVLSCAVLFLHDEDSIDLQIDFQATLDDLPIPVWVRGQDLQLRWANSAFLSAVGATSCKQAVRANAILAPAECDLVTAARAGAKIANAQCDMDFHDERRTLAMSLGRLPDSSILCSAIDITDTVRSEAKMRAEADATTDMLNKVSLGVAVFGQNQRLLSCNSRFASMWALPQEWLDTQPAHAEILERLRLSRLLPERSDFEASKIQSLLEFNCGTHRADETWRLPNGRSVRVVVEPHLQGGFYVTYEDVTEQVDLKAAVAALSAVQKSTLEAMEDAVAVFERDGRIVQFNKAFAKLWRLTGAELSGEPHFSKIAAICFNRIGRDETWDIVSSAVASENPALFGEWGNVTRADGRVISLAPCSLPGGGTLVTFHDVTHIARFPAPLMEQVRRAA